MTMNTFFSFPFTVYKYAFVETLIPIVTFECPFRFPGFFLKKKKMNPELTREIIRNFPF